MSSCLGERNTLNGSFGVLTTSAGNSVAASHFSRFQTYQPTALSAVVNLNSVTNQTPPTLTRNDRRALASVGIVPSASNTLPKQRYGNRKAASNGRTVNATADYDLRAGSTVGIDSGGFAYGVLDPRLEHQPHVSLRRRTLSATGLRTCADSSQSNGVRVNPRMLTASTANGAHGSQTNLSSPGGVSPGGHYLCSMYAFPNVLKVAPQPQTATNLSVISGPAPVTYRPNGTTGTVVTAQDNASHRLAGTSPGLLR